MVLRLNSLCFTGGVVALAALAGCGGSGSPSEPVLAPVLTLDLPFHIFRPGESAALSAAVSKGALGVVTCVATAGTLVQDGSTWTYTAPAAPGTYAISATMQGSPSLTATIPVSVVSVAFTKIGSLPEGPGQGAYFTATWLDEEAIFVDSMSALGPMIWDFTTGHARRAALCPIKPMFPDTVRLKSGRIVQIAGGDPFSTTPVPSAIYLYDFESDTWTLEGNTSYPWLGLEASVLTKDGMVMTSGGETGRSGELATIEIWRPMNGGNATNIGFMGTPRSGHTATLLANGSVLMAGGQYGTTNLASSDIVDTAYSVSAGPLMGMARSGHLAVPLSDGRVLMVAGGTNDLELFDPAARVFRPAGHLDANVSFLPAAAPLPGGRALIVGGYAPGMGTPATGAIQVFVAEHLESRALAALPVPVYGAKLVNGFSGALYLVGGSAPGSAMVTDIFEITVD